jgi:hypothetical protein
MYHFGPDGNVPRISWALDVFQKKNQKKKQKLHLPTCVKSVSKVTRKSRRLQLALVTVFSTLLPLALLFLALFYL